MATAARLQRLPFAPCLAAEEITLAIGCVAVALRSGDGEFLRMLADRYAGFACDSAQPHFTFDVTIIDRKRPAGISAEDICVRREGRGWRVERGDFAAAWDSATRHGWLEQSALSYAPYATDTLLRVVHSIALAERGGFLLHAASALRNGRVFLFSGVSGAGKTTLSRLAPPDVRVLTDEISYVLPDSRGYRAYGTPFAGELARIGENVSAPVAGLYLLEKAQSNFLLTADDTSVFRALLRNVLFLSNDEDLVRMIFESCIHFVSTMPAYRMHFTPDARAWELIR